MWYWAIGQVGFGEQIQAYGDTFWRQVGSPLLWTLSVLWVVLALTALVISLYERSAAKKSTVGAGPYSSAQPGFPAGPTGAASAERGGAKAA
jgi:hypothetical protein